MRRTGSDRPWSEPEAIAFQPLLPMAEIRSALKLEGIVKSFDGRPALDHASFEARWGEVHGLLGENGAGKSSLMNVLCGLYAAEHGTIEIDAVRAVIDGPAGARRHGVGMVHQHFKLVRSFTVVENVMLANPPATWRAGLRRVTGEIMRLAAELEFDVEPSARMDTLSVAEQQRVEIIKALITGARILILDEPTAVLTDAEAERLLSVTRQIARRGACVILITHKLNEAVTFADRVTVMRAGRTVATSEAQSLTVAELARLMVGDPAVESNAPSCRIGGVVMQANELKARRDDGAPSLHGLSLGVRSGEIYGLAGVGGNGQTEFAEILMGVRGSDDGSVSIEGRDVSHLSPGARRGLGQRAIPADRYVYGLSGDMSVAENLGVSDLRSGRFGPFLWQSHARLRSRAVAAIEAFEIQGATPGLRARLLSGGNAQKLVLARELDGAPRLIIAHAPTRGLDVRACLAVHRHLRAARDAGCAVLLISEDLDEILVLSDRIGVINRGRIIGEFDQPADRHAIGELMVGHA